MKMSAHVWEQTCFVLPEIFGRTLDRPRRTPIPVKVAAWFRARPGRIERLGLNGLSGSMQMPPVLTSMLITTQASSLTHLSIDVSPFGISGPGLGILAVMDKLAHLAVHVSGGGLNDWGAAVIQAASCMTRLRQLEVVHVKMSGGNHIDHQDVKLPRCQELAVLSSKSITMLSVQLAAARMTCCIWRGSGTCGCVTCLGTQPAPPSVGSSQRALKGARGWLS